MTDKVVTLQRKLTLALQLMTQYQRDRHTRLWNKFVEKERVIPRTGRPREFKGHVPGQARPEDRIDVC